MTELELMKIKLLSLSKNMLMMAQNKEWEKLSEQDSSWQELLKSADEEFGASLDVIGPELLADNEQIQEILKCEQQKLSQEMQKNNQSVSSIKQYLK